MRRTQEGFVPFKDDKTKDAENTDFEAGSNNTPMANLLGSWLQGSALPLGKPQRAF